MCQAVGLQVARLDRLEMIVVALSLRTQHGYIQRAVTESAKYFDPR